MVIYPLSAAEEIAVRWAARIVPVLATTVILLLGAISIAAS